MTQFNTIFNNNQKKKKKKKKKKITTIPEIHEILSDSLHHVKNNFPNCSSNSHSNYKRTLTILKKNFLSFLLTPEEQDHRIKKNNCLILYPIP